MPYVDKAMNRVLKWESVDVTIPEMIELVQKTILEKSSDKDLAELEKGMQKTFVLAVGRGCNLRYYPSSSYPARLCLEFSIFTHQLYKISLLDTVNKKEYFIPKGKASCARLQSGVQRRMAQCGYRGKNTGKHSGSSGKFSSHPPRKKGNLVIPFLVAIGIVLGGMFFYNQRTKKKDGDISELTQNSNYEESTDVTEQRIQDVQPFQDSGHEQLETFPNQSKAEASGDNEKALPTGIDENELIDDIYELMLFTARDNIDSILAKTPVDMDKLQSEYEFLLSLKISEYTFKRSAYIHFNGEDDEKTFDEVLSEIRTISEEMKQYLPEEDVDWFYKYMAVSSVSSFDDGCFDYDAMLVGNKKEPDIDKMWNNYIDALVLNSGNDLGMFPDFEYTEPDEVFEPDTTIPQQPNITESGNLEGYVMYGTGGLNVRNGPGAFYEQIGRLPEGERVVILETQYSETAEWGRIETGWICMDYVEVAEQRSDDTSGISMTVRVKPSAEELRIRNGPGSGYIEVGRLTGGEYVTVTEIQTNGGRQWGRIPAGWICMDYVDTAYSTQGNYSGG